MYNYFLKKNIKPNGWLKRQLEIQARGLSGNLDKLCPDIKDSAWIGGTHEGWERVPYWLDGFIPLSFYLNNKDMIKRSKQFIYAIIKRQNEDGWICPCVKEKRTTYDMWALFLIGKVFVEYYEFTNDENVKVSLYKAMKNFYELYDKNEVSLFEWGKFRWFECLIPLKFLYDFYKEEWILSLAKKLKENGTNYFDYIQTWKTPMNKWTFHTHIVNIAMMFKYEVLYCDLLNLKYTNAAEKLWKVLDKYNGSANGIFTGDECLSGKYNNQGTELCAVVELMYSCELLYSLTKDNIWAERLEKLAFNALPATISDDMWTHQYDQMVNQIACIYFPGKPIYRTNGRDANVFGVEPNYGCCTANFNQGWPKLVDNIYLKTSKGILCNLMLPSSLNTTIKNSNVSINIKTNYPFRHSCKYIINVDKPVNFELKIRIPSWAKKVYLNNEAVKNKGYITINKKWSNKETIEIKLVDQVRFVKRPYNLNCVEYGPLLFSLPINTIYEKHEYENDGVLYKEPYCNYYLLPNSNWNYGFINKKTKIIKNRIDNIPFSSKNPPLAIKVEMSKIDWGYEDGYDCVSRYKPKSKIALSDNETKFLHPYGCSKLRMTEMPFVKYVYKEKKYDK